MFYNGFFPDEHRKSLQSEPVIHWLWLIELLKRMKLNNAIKYSEVDV